MSTPAGPVPVQDPRAALAALSTKRTTVTVGESTFALRTISAAEAMEFREYAGKDEVSGLQATLRIVALCLCEPDGKPVFKLEEQDELGKIPLLDLQAIAEAAVKWNRLDKESVEAAKGKSVGAGPAASLSA